MQFLIASSWPGSGSTQPKNTHHHQSGRISVYFVLSLECQLTFRATKVWIPPYRDELPGYRVLYNSSSRPLRGTLHLSIELPGFARSSSGILAGQALLRGSLENPVNATKLPGRKKGPCGCIGREVGNIGACW